MSNNFNNLQIWTVPYRVPKPPGREDGRGQRRFFHGARGTVTPEKLRQYGIELIAPHRSNRKNTTQDLRRMRRYRRRWRIERLFAWLQNFRRLVVRYERYAENFLGVLYLGCCLILLRHL